MVRRDRSEVVKTGVRQAATSSKRGNYSTAVYNIVRCGLTASIVGRKVPSAPLIRFQPAAGDSTPPHGRRLEGPLVSLACAGGPRRGEGGRDYRARCEWIGGRIH